MTKEKIVYIGSNLPDKTPAGVRVFANALALRDYGFDVKLISKDIDFQTDFDVNEGMDTWHLPRPRSTKEWMATLVDAKSYTKIIDGIGDVRVVIAYELPAVAFLRLSKYCKRKGIKLICETAEWQKWEHLGNLGKVARTVRVLDINTSMYYAYRQCDGLIVTSNYFSSKFNGCLPTLVLPTLQCHRLEIPKLERVNAVRKFIYAGGMGYGKDLLQDIIRAFGSVSDRPFEFNILGLTKEQYLKRFSDDTEIINSINQHSEKIKFWGRVSHNEVLAAVRQSDFAIIIRENAHRNNIGFPTKFGESINCGTPVIVTDFSDVVYYTRKYGVGIITEVNNIQKGIIDALDMDDTALLEMHENCRKCTAFYYKGHVDEIGNYVKEIIK